MSRVLRTTPRTLGFSSRFVIVISAVHSRPDRVAHLRARATRIAYGSCASCSSSVAEQPAAVRVEQVADRAAEQRVGQVAEDALDRLALVLDDAVGVDDGDDVRGVLDERLEALLALAELSQAFLRGAA